MQSQVKFNRGSGEGSEEGLGGFGAEPSQVQQRFRRRFRRRSERLWCRARSGSTEVPEKVPKKVWEALVQSQIRFNRGSGEGSKEGLGGFGGEPGQVQQRFRRSSEAGSRKPWCRAGSG